MDYPKRPIRPTILRKISYDLTNDEVEALPAARRAYAQALATFDLELTRYHDLEEAKVREVRHRCEVEHGLVDHPKADLLWQKAWSRAHSFGLESVVAQYADLVELVR